MDDVSMTISAALRLACVRAKRSCLHFHDTCTVRKLPLNRVVVCSTPPSFPVSVEDFSTGGEEMMHSGAVPLSYIPLIRSHFFLISKQHSSARMHVPTVKHSRNSHALISIVLLNREVSKDP